MSRFAPGAASAGTSACTLALAFFSAGIFATTLTGCAGSDAKAPTGKTERRTLAAGGAWRPEVRAAIDRLLLDRGRGGPHFSESKPPVAVFDWDNTMMKGDIGDTTLFWMLRHDKIFQPQRRNWLSTSKHLNFEALRSLAAGCNEAGAPGAPLATSRFPACADAITAIYLDGVTNTGARAWALERTSTFEASAAWAAQLMVGHSVDELRGFATAAFDEASQKPIGATFTVGSRANVPAAVKIYDEMRDLVGAMKDEGFDVYVVSASAQPIVEIVAASVGVDRSHVIGVRTTVDDQLRVTSSIAGCATLEEGIDTLIPYDVGKLCWINRVIFSLLPREQLSRPGRDEERPVFVAGDSDGDVAMLQDATTLKLVINRGKPGIMCNAYGNVGNRWLVQPMFIGPQPQRATPFPCATLLDGDGRPAVDESGQPMHDAVDSSYALP